MTKYILFRNCPRLKRVFILDIARGIEKLTRAGSLPLAALIRRPDARL